MSPPIMSLGKGYTIMETLIILWSVFNFALFPVRADNEYTDIEDSPLTEVQAVAGGRALLPCEMDPPVEDDETYIVLIFRAGSHTPIYSLDSRSSSLALGSHWAEDSLDGRAYITLTGSQKGLLLEEVKIDDAGEYRCRVDFLHSPTRNQRIKLNVIVPSTALKITLDNPKDGTREDISGTIGPFLEGTLLTLSCQATGGDPQPVVTWWDGGFLMDGESEFFTSTSVRNILTLPPLNQDDLNKTLTCQANNSDLTIPLSGSVTLDLTYPPNSLKLLGIGDQVVLSEGVTEHLVCEAEGSRPPAHITWWMGKQPLSDPQTIEISGNVSRSTLSFTPSADDDGDILICKAVSPSLLHDPLYNSTKIKVLYKPQIKLKLGMNLDIEDIEEGDDIYFTCNIKSNPPVTGVQWARNGVPLSSNSTNGIIISPTSLVLTEITGKATGNYTCAAANSQGSSTSNAISIRVKFLPVCAEEQKTIYGSAINEEVAVTCHVTSYPAPKTFRWAINNSWNELDTTHNSSYFPLSTIMDETNSVLSYTPISQHHYGSLLCWGFNDIGEQIEPCQFNIIPVDKPDPVSGCVAERNSTMPSTYVVVKCIPGWDGGLEQTFTLEIRRADTQQILDEFRLAHKPFFVVTGVQQNIRYMFIVTASNSQGSSRPYTVLYASQDGSVLDSQMTTADGYALFLTITPFLILFIGVIIAIIVCVTITIITSRRKRRSKSGAEILYAGPIKGSSYDPLDVHTLICPKKDCEKHDWNDDKNSVGKSYASTEKLNNSTTALETDSLLKEKLSALEGLAPLASSDSFSKYSTHSSNCSTSSRNMSNKSIKITNAKGYSSDFLKGEPNDEILSETPLIKFPKESCV